MAHGGRITGGAEGCGEKVAAHEKKIKELEEQVSDGTGVDDDEFQTSMKMVEAELARVAGGKT